MTSEDAKRDFLKQIANAKKAYDAKAKLADSNIVTTITNSCLRMEGTIKRLMRATYTAYSYTNPVTGKLVKNKRPRSVPDAAPAPQAGTLMRSYTHDVQVSDKTVIGRTGSTLRGYPAYLENGTSKMAARPSVLPALDAEKRRIKSDLLFAISTDRAVAEVTTSD
jgi:hypothetical protein